MGVGVPVIRALYDRVQLPSPRYTASWLVSGCVSAALVSGTAKPTQTVFSTPLHATCLFQAGRYRTKLPPLCQNMLPEALLAVFLIPL